MQPLYVKGSVFEKQDYTQIRLAIGEYEECVFQNCDFSHSTLSASSFMDCVFVSCNLSMVNLAQTAFRGVDFKDSKLLGLSFEHCNTFGFSVTFDHCVLNHASFYQLKLKNTLFKGSQLQEVDFTESILTGAVFADCDLTRVVFENTVLEKADFRTAFNYSIDPQSNRMKGAKFSLNGLVGLLDRYDLEIE